MKLIFIISVITSLHTCCATKTMATQNTNSNLTSDINGTYHVKSVNGHEISETELILSFDADKQRLSGFSGCNRFTGSYTLGKNAIKIGPLVSTKKMCPEESNSIESEMLDALNNANMIRFNVGILELLKDKTIIMSATKSVESLSPTFIYIAQSRGTYLKLIINQSTISITKDKNSQLVSKSIKTNAWDKLVTALKGINLDSLSNYKAPTEARFYDGAAIGKLEIEVGDKTYESVPFDHGNPPLEIEALVKEILSISQNVE